MIKYRSTQVFGCKVIAKAAGCQILFCRLIVLFPFSALLPGVEREQAAGLIYAWVAEIVFQEGFIRKSIG